MYEYVNQMITGYTIVSRYTSLMQMSDRKPDDKSAPPGKNLRPWKRKRFG